MPVTPNQPTPVSSVPLRAAYDWAAGIESAEVDNTQNQFISVIDPTSKIDTKIQGDG
jgi:hypothetical protein